ncbi:MAG: hypothetical protein RIM84_16060 [Alphaproteobacteria bacterium]
MAEYGELAERYLQRHPREAVAVLETIDPVDTATLLPTIGDDLAADVLTRLSPAVAAACLEALPPAVAARYLGDMPRRAAASLLRQVDAGRRGELLHALKAPTRMQLQVILHQPSHRVGAWIDTNVATIETGTPVSLARQRLTHADVPPGAVYLVDAAQRLLGFVSVRRLLTLAGTDTVDDAAMPARGVLRANGSTESALDEPAWDEVDSLPVVDHDGKLIGNIRHAALRRAQQQQQAAAAAHESGEYMSLANSVYVGLAEILSTSMAKGNNAGAAASTGEKPR